jgi:hypothetical protein
MLIDGSNSERRTSPSFADAETLVAIILSPKCRLVPRSAQLCCVAIPSETLDRSMQHSRNQVLYMTRDITDASSVRHLAFC